MTNRNPYSNSSSIPNYLNKNSENSLQITTNNYFNFLQDQFTIDFLSSQPYSINEFSSNVFQGYVLNYSKNSSIEYPSRKNSIKVKSPKKEIDTDIKKRVDFGFQKMSLPDHKREWNLNKQQFRQNKNQNLLRDNKKLQTEENTNYTSVQSASYKDQYFSEKTLQGKQIQKKYQFLKRSHECLQQQFEKIRQQNFKLKKSKEQLMQQNLKIKKQRSEQVQHLISETNRLKQQIYRIQMQHQSKSNRGFKINNNFNTSLNSISSARGSYNHRTDATFNAFYVQELEKQNGQLMQQNRRLNNIVMKKLKHSIID